MGVEIEIEGGPQGTTPNITEDVRTVPRGLYMTQDSPAIYIAGFDTIGSFGFVDRVIKSAFTAAPVQLALVDPTDVPVGIANDATFIYVLCRTAALGTSVTRILKADFLTQTRVVAGDPPIHTPNQIPIVDGTDLVFCATDNVTTDQRCCKLDLIGFAAFTSVLNASPTVTANQPVLDTVNGKYWVPSVTHPLAGNCAPAMMSVDRATFLWDVTGCGIFANVTRVTPITLGLGLDNCLTDGGNIYIASPNVVPSMIASVPVPSLIGGISTSLPGTSQIPAPGCMNQDAQDSAFMYISDNGSPVTVWKYRKSNLNIGGSHTLPAGANNSNYVLVDTPNQFVYTLTISGVARLVRSGFGLF